jgi:hypothetical protein
MVVLLFADMQARRPPGIKRQLDVSFQ